MAEQTVFSHTSVLLHECIDGLDIRHGYTYLDCTTGGGGHSYEIAKRLSENDRLLCFDRDADAIKAAKARLTPFLDRIVFINENYSELDRVLSSMDLPPLGGVLMDLGCSSFQFDTPERGFSYMHSAHLDMRMSQDAPLDAYQVVNGYSEADLRRIIFDYGEERFAGKIASAIVRRRTDSPIETTSELSDLICGVIPKSARADGPHPAKRTFQAIRIEVNGELEAIAPTINAATKHMAPSGRIVIISFHSLEDRAVKQAYTALAAGCECPRDFPVCVCNKKPSVEILTKKPILPSETELNENPRARSAKLRIAKKLERV